MTFAIYGVRYVIRRVNSLSDTNNSHSGDVMSPEWLFVSVGVDRRFVHTFCLVPPPL